MIAAIVAWFIWLDDRAYLRQRRAERAQRWAELDERFAELAGMR